MSERKNSRAVRSRRKTAPGRTRFCTGVERNSDSGVPAMNALPGSATGARNSPPAAQLT